MRCDTAQIGEDTQFEIIVSETKLNWLPGIVGDGLSSDIDIAHSKLIARSNHHAALQPLEFAASSGACREKYGQIIGLGKRHHSSTMITVLMGHQNGVDVRPAHTARLKPLLHVTARQTAVNQ
jgi:hypothetical protein